MEIANIIKDNMIDNTDIIFVLDKTGSMSDAIDNINIGLKQIMIFLQKHENIRLEKATYGDKNIHLIISFDETRRSNIGKRLKSSKVKKLHGPRSQKIIFLMIELI